MAPDAEGHSPYVGDGCDVAPHCLKCPLPACKYDDYAAYYIWRRRELDDPIEAMLIEGLKIREIAERLGKGERLIYRAVIRIRNRNA